MNLHEIYIFNPMDPEIKAPLLWASLLDMGFINGEVEYRRR